MPDTDLPAVDQLRSPPVTPPSATGTPPVSVARPPGRPQAARRSTTTGMPIDGASVMLRRTCCIR